MYLAEPEHAPERELEVARKLGQPGAGAVDERLTARAGNRHFGLLSALRAHM